MTTSTREAVDTPRRQATKARLVQAAISEFAMRGIDATSVEQLCDAAGFSRGAFYSNFDSKDDICIEVAEHMSREMGTALAHALQDMPSEISHHEIVGWLLSIRATIPEVHQTQMELELRAQRDPAFGERYREARKQLWPPYVELVQRIGERAGVKFLVDVQDLLYVLEAIYFYPSAGEGPSDRAARLIALVTRHVTEGID